MQNEAFFSTQTKPHQRSLSTKGYAGSLVPQPKGVVQMFGHSGEDTFYSLDLIKELATANAGEAEKLSLYLKKDTLAATLANIRTFVYRNFQYLQDTDFQDVRTLAYAYHRQRESGIDCKSYSTIISQILQCLGIVHYLRKVKQPRTHQGQPQDFEKNYSHVYVVVPKNQKTHNLKEGYHVLDAVPNTLDEPAFIQNYDLKIEPMQHRGLFGTAPSTPPNLTNTQLTSIDVADDNQGEAVATLRIFKPETGETEQVQVPIDQCAPALEGLAGLGCDCTKPSLGLGIAPAVVAAFSQVMASLDFNAIITNIFGKSGYRQSMKNSMLENNGLCETLPAALYPPLRNIDKLSPSQLRKLQDCLRFHIGGYQRAHEADPKNITKLKLDTWTELSNEFIALIDEIFARAANVGKGGSADDPTNENGKLPGTNTANVFGSIKELLTPKNLLIAVGVIGGAYAVRKNVSTFKKVATPKSKPIHA